MKKGYTWGWIAWFGMFGILEAAAWLDKDTGDTLSEHVWHWFGIDGDWSLGAVGLLLGSAWLGGHFAFKKWSVRRNRNEE